MEYTLEFVQTLALPNQESFDEEEQLEILAGCHWAEQNTKFRFDEHPTVPATVKIFLLRFRDVLHSGLACGVLSERMAGLSQAGLSQAFAVSHGLDGLIRQLACELLRPWYEPVDVIVSQTRYM